MTKEKLVNVTQFKAMSRQSCCPHCRMKQKNKKYKNKNKIFHIMAIMDMDYDSVFEHRYRIKMALLHKH